MEQETLTEVAVSVGAVAVFVIVFIGTGVAFGPTFAGVGALALVGGITLFVVLMAVAGYWLAGQETGT